jgi:ubiquinone/menaquinone biosynthesis C-methylase UbiE
MSQLAKEVTLPTTAEINAVVSRQISPAENTEQRHSEQSESLFERFAWLYIFCREKLFRDDTERIVAGLWSGSKPRSETRLIELGCGPGFYSCRLAARFSQLSVLGVDSSRKQVNWAREKVRAQELTNCTFERVNVLALSYDSESFENLIASRLLTILPARERAVAEMFRILRPGGKCFVAEPRYSFWASLPLFAMWMLASVTRYGNGYREPRKASVLSQAAFKRLFATQPWKEVRTWQEGRYQYALCEKG